jgi:hypothetical protein
MPIRNTDLGSSLEEGWIYRKHNCTVRFTPNQLGSLVIEDVESLEKGKKTFSRLSQ